MSMSEIVMSQTTVGTLMTGQDIIVFALILAISVAFLDFKILKQIADMPLLPRFR